RSAATRASMRLGRTRLRRRKKIKDLILRSRAITAFTPVFDGLRHGVSKDGRELVPCIHPSRRVFGAPNTQGSARFQIDFEIAHALSFVADRLQPLLDDRLVVLVQRNALASNVRGRFALIAVR